ncbi:MULTISPECIES: helix-turn-helix domain-containing protein [Enterobacteriaceae]|uniref:helix-turn-helix domain-containing protein n=1 Tax=Enterobacteriaceae TaxID=543 RepID=UPI000CF043CE|nr:MULTISPECIES: transcriptional regulator [Enterobacteriaceae]MCE9977271.1 transcriptional regulator [Leclercia adecarboxylata]PPY04504.1 transcriptional regulator [Cronobacter sakazakii]WNY85561.1 transcriptional regulator [Leclercia adecarboxylata]
MNMPEIIKAGAALFAVAPFIAGIRTEEQHAAALEFVENLIDANDTDNPLFEIVAAKIKEYESTAPEYAELNARLAAIPTGVAVLRTLISQHDLTLSDLPEIGGKSMVSRVLKGERKLSLDHIKALAARFGMSPALFID